jgi:hypothetical protein
MAGQMGQSGGQTRFVSPHSDPGMCASLTAQPESIYISLNLRTNNGNN